MPRILRVAVVSLSLAWGTALAGGQDLRGPDLSNYEVLADTLDRHLIPDLILLDVRSEEAFSKGHIPGSVNIPLDRLFSEYPSNSAMTPILIIGRPGSSDGRKATDILRTRGYRNVVLFGSISQWKGELQ